MATETPVLENKTEEKLTAPRAFNRSYVENFSEEEAHNARIRDTYARLINPDCRLEDVFMANTNQTVENVASAEAPMPAQMPAPAAPKLYRVENARADAAIFRADNPINSAVNYAVNPALGEQNVQSAEIINEAAPEEENDDLRPTPTTIQYQTIGQANANAEIKSVTDKRAHVLNKKEKIIIAVFVSVVVALLALVIINSSVIANLNADIADVQNNIDTVRGALAGINATVSEIVPDTLKDIIIK